MTIGEMIAPREAFGKALCDLVEQLLTWSCWTRTSCTSTCTHFFREIPSRFYQMGIAEQNMVSVAAGMATLGLVPFVSTFAVFLAKRAADQIRVSVAYPRLNVKLNGSYAGVPTGRAGATHSSVEDIAVMRAMPNMIVLAPADAHETAQAVELALRTNGPVYVRTVRCPVRTIFGEEHRLEIGRSHVLSEGRDAGHHLHRHDDAQGG